MSMTDLKAFGESWARGTRKLPAAPALKDNGVSVDASLGHTVGERENKHEKVNATEFFHAGVNCFLETLYAPNVNGPNANNSATLARGSNVLCHPLRLLDIAADDAGVGAQMNEGADLDRADTAIASSAEDNFAIEEAVFPHFGEVFRLFEGHGDDGSQVLWSRAR